MARAPILSVSPDLDLQKGIEQIEQMRAAQTQGVQNFGSEMDQRLQGIYGQLTGSLQQGVSTTQNIYNKSQDQIRSAYGGAEAVNAAGSNQVQNQLRGMAQQLGLDERALAEVSGRLGQQAATFQMRNQQSMADRVATQAQLGAGMSAVSQFALNAANQAMAQGRQDLARRVATEIQRANTLAAATRSDFTATKANQAARAAAAAETEARKAMAELAREARANQRAAAAEARANARAARSGGGSKYADRDQMMQEAKFQAWLDDRNAPAEANPYDLVLNEIKNDPRFAEGSNSLAYILAASEGMDVRDMRTPKGKKLNTSLLNAQAARLKAARRGG